MKLPIPMLLGLLSVSVVAHAQEKGAAENDSVIIQGNWDATSSNTEGKDLPKSELRISRLVVKGDEWNYSLGGGAVLLDPAPKFSLDQNAIPKTIDVTSRRKNQQGKSLLRGIYELDGDVLKICFAVGSAARPKKFKSEAGSKSSITVYRRVK